MTMFGTNTSLSDTISGMLPLVRSRPNTEIVAAVREEEQQLKGISKTTLRERADRVRRRGTRDRGERLQQRSVGLTADRQRPMVLETRAPVW